MTRPAVLLLVLGFALGSLHETTSPPLVLEGWIDQWTYEKLLPRQRKILIGLIEARERGEEIPLACWSPGTDLDIVAAFSAASRAPEGTSLS